MNEFDNHDDGTSISGVIKHPCIVTFTDMPETALLPHGLRLLCGTIQQVLDMIDPRQIKSLLDAGFTDIRLPE